MAAVERLHALSHRLYRVGLRPVGTIIQAFSRITWGISLPASVEVGRDTSFANGGLGVVIHPRARIGANCVISSGVSVGCRSKLPDVPVIEDDCFIGTGAKILGPVRVGAGSIIGANAVVLEDVPPNSMVVGAPGRVVKSGVWARDYADMPRELVGLEAARRAGQR